MGYLPGMSDWGQWAEQIRDNPSKWAVSLAFHLVDEHNVRAACVERLDDFKNPAEAQAVVVTDAGVLFSSYTFGGRDEWSGSSRLFPWHEVTAVEVEQAGTGHRDATVKAVRVLTADGPFTLPLKEDHYELSADETDVVRAILSRRTA